ncbi:MAG: homoserine kinase [Bacillota bacterium]|nr:homoserine kinase [Bacillota bacterium]
MPKIILPATSANLGCGFDCMGMALGIYNEIEFEKRESGLTIELEPHDMGRISIRENNLIYRTAKSIVEQRGQKMPGLWMRQKNNIPITRGLGSSAACTVGGILMADILLGGKLTMQEKMETAARMEGHPDNVVPVFLGGITITFWAGGTLKHFKITPPKGLMAALMVPDFSLSTKAARALLPRKVRMDDAVGNIGRAAMLCAKLASGNTQDIASCFDDRLHQPYRKGMVVGYDEIIEASYALGARGAYLSGAGPSIVALVANGEEFAAKMVERLKKIEGGWSVRTAEICSEGAKVG